MIKNITKILATSILLLSFFNIINYSTVSAADNILKAGYGFTALNVAPRTYVDSRYTKNEKGGNSNNYFSLYSEDDNNELKSLKTGNKTWCFVAGCTNTSHMHRTDNFECKYGITNTKKESFLKKLWNGEGIYVEKEGFYNIGTVNFSQIATDFSNLSSETTYKVKLENNKYYVNKSMRVDYSFTDDKVNFILADNSGVDNGSASIKIIDRNTNKTIKTLNAEQLKKQLTNTTKKSNGKITTGVYSIPLDKFTKNDKDVYKIKVETVEGSGMKGSDMVNFKVKYIKNNSTENSTQKPQEEVKTKPIPSDVKINREIRLEVDSENKNNLKINLKDNSGLSSLKVTTYDSADTKIHSYAISGKNCNSDKDLSKNIKYEKYDANKNMATLVINKKYFDNNSKNKDGKIVFLIEATDTSGLTCTEKIYATSTKNGWAMNRAPRVSVDYKNGILKLTMTDNSGITTGKALLKVKDLNANDIIMYKDWMHLGAELTDIKKVDNVIVQGTYKLNITKLKLDANNYYKLKITSIDHGGHSRVQEVNLKAEM